MKRQLTYRTNQKILLLWRFVGFGYILWSIFTGLANQFYDSQSFQPLLFFFKRFYLKASFSEFDPRLVGPTMLFLAAKVEECSVPNFLTALKQVDPSWPYKMEMILECEFYALHYLNFDLIVFHPYRPLTQYLSGVKMQDLLQTAWNIVNDSYRTDLSLRYAPYLIAIAAIYMACDLRKDYGAWLNSLSVKLEASHDRQINAIKRELLDLYDEYSITKTVDTTTEVLRKLDDYWKKKKIVGRTDPKVTKTQSKK